MYPVGFYCVLPSPQQPDTNVLSVVLAGFDRRNSDSSAWLLVGVYTLTCRVLKIRKLAHTQDRGVSGKGDNSVSQRVAVLGLVRLFPRFAIPNGSHTITPATLSHQVITGRIPPKSPPFKMFPSRPQHRLSSDTPRAQLFRRLHAGTRMRQEKIQSQPRDEPITLGTHEASRNIRTVIRFPRKYSNER